MFRDLAVVSKTVRFTQSEWQRWQRLMDCLTYYTWADTVKEALRLLEARELHSGLGEAFGVGEQLGNDIEDTAILLSTSPASIKARLAAKGMVLQERCQKCNGLIEQGRDGALLCALCQARADGVITTGTQLEKANKGKQKSAAAAGRSSPAASRQKPTAASKARKGQKGGEE